MTLEEYFRINASKNIIDHKVRCYFIGPFPCFYIRPDGKDGDTPNFLVIENELRDMPKPESCQHPLEYIYSAPITNALTRRTIQGRYCLCGKNMLPDLKP